MNASQKGTKLNEIRYFRQPRPYARKRITKMRLLPDTSGLQENVISSTKNQYRRTTSSRSSERSRDRCITLDRDQRSREIAWISYTNDADEFDNLKLIKGHARNRDTFVETDPEIQIVVNNPKPENFVPEVIEDVEPRTQSKVKIAQSEQETKIEETTNALERNFDEKKDITEREVEENKNESEEKSNEMKGNKVEETNDIRDNKIIEETKDSLKKVLEKQEEKISTKTKFHEEGKKGSLKKDRRDRSFSQSSEKSRSESEKSFWWRYESIRKILDFFGHLLGRRGTINRDKERGARVRKSDTNSSNDETNMDSSTKNRRSSKNKSVEGKITLTKQNEDHVFSGLTKHIVDIRDEKLRATLLEHEMRSRKLEEENRRYKRILEDKLKTRQMSSPLH